jgi:tetratricopeptide (TPR) repeat protein
LPTRAQKRYEQFRNMSKLITVILILCPILVASSANGEDRAAARAAFMRASQHYKLGEYKEALVEFKAAYRNFEVSTFLFNIAQCERQLEMREEALREYRMYLAEAPDAPNRDEVREMIARLEREVASEKAKREAEEQRRQEANRAVATPAPTSVDATTSVTAKAPPRRATPAYKKWWVWTIVGGVVVGGAAAGLAIGLTRASAAPTANTVLGTAHPFN